MPLLGLFSSSCYVSIRELRERIAIAACMLVRGAVGVPIGIPDNGKEDSVS